MIFGPQTGLSGCLIIQHKANGAAVLAADDTSTSSNSSTTPERVVAVPLNTVMYSLSEQRFKCHYCYAANCRRKRWHLANDAVSCCTLCCSLSPPAGLFLPFVSLWGYQRIKQYLYKRRASILADIHTVFRDAFLLGLYSLVDTTVRCDISLRPAVPRRRRLFAGLDVGFVV